MQIYKLTILGTIIKGVTTAVVVDTVLIMTFIYN